MDKLWIKLLKAYAGYAAGQIVEVDAPIARAYITAQYAEEHKQAADTLTRSAQDEIKAVVAEIRTANDELQRSITQSLAGVAGALRPSPQIRATESEDDKLLPTGGFRSMGHFAYAINRGLNPGSPDPKFHGELSKYRECYDRVASAHVLTRATDGSMSENVDPDGGMAIPPTYSQQIWERTRKYENISDRLTMIPIGGNSFRMPADAETSRADGQRRGGIAGYWEGEAAQYSKSKPTLSDRYLRLKKLTVLVYATNELLDDAPALEGYINRVAPEEITFKINDAVVNGSGAGMPLGLVKSPAMVAIAKESGQAAASIVAANIIKMWFRLYAPCRNDAVWYINQDCEAQLQQMALATGTYSGQLIYMPPTGLSQSPYGTLYGKPVIPIEQCQTCGTQGDIILASLSETLAIRKAAGVQQSMSIHLRFDYDETVFKFSFRMDAQCAWSAPLTPKNGTNTQSPIITLATRS